MSFKIKEEHKTFVRVFITYGIHLWLLIFISNVVIFYSIRFFINASTTRTPNITPSPKLAIDTTAQITDFPTPIPTAAGPIINISFSLPGIGTNGGNLQPLNPSRDVNIYLYDSDSNTSDTNVKPAYAIKVQAVYDNDPNSSTYTLFVNNYVDLGPVEEKTYQIAIQTPQSLRNLLKSSDPRALEGQLFQLSPRRFSVLEKQSMITGDIYPLPNGDNLIDINDYNMFVSCYGSSTYISKCADPAPADLDNNGIVDGIDYNIILMNFRTLLSMGLPVPTIKISPSVKPTQQISTTPKKNVSPTPVQKNISRSDGIGIIIIFILFIIVVAVIAFVSYKFHLLRILFPKKMMEDLENSTEPPLEQQTEETPADQPVNNTPAPDEVEKPVYLKKVRVDEQAKGTWVTLADDSGITQGFYPNLNVSDGFVNIKGTMKNDEENKPYILITELNPAE